VEAKLRRSQLVTTWGPGAFLDLPEDAVIISGLDEWPRAKMEEIDEPRLRAKITQILGYHSPKLYAPPIAQDGEHWQNVPFVRGFRFPEWLVVREDAALKGSPPVPESRPSPRARRLVRIQQLSKGRFEGRAVIPTRFVVACPKGHVSDLDWHRFVHKGDTDCNRQIWLDEQGTSGEIGDTIVKCECGVDRSLFEATHHKEGVLGHCRGERPWLGAYSRETCTEMGRLLIRTASNAYFAQTLSALSLPDRGSELEERVRSILQIIGNATSPEQVQGLRIVDQVREALDPYTNEEVIGALQSVRGGGAVDRPVKLVELDAILSEPEGYEDDVPVDPNFHARRLPDHVWRHGSHTDKVASVVQLHRLRIVTALLGFTRFEAEIPDIYGEFETDVKRASLAKEANWFPAVEVRGEGLFLQISPQAISEWESRPAVQERLKALQHGHELWLQRRQRQGDHPGAAYVMLHTLSHLLMQSVSMYAGYPASSIVERVYVDDQRKRYGILLYTATNDAEGTLGGLVAQAKHVSRRLEEALRSAALCSNDPVCAQHLPDQHFEDRWLHGASCHGCTLTSETSCEMRNDHLDRGLVVPILGADPSAAFFDLVT